MNVQKPECFVVPVICTRCGKFFDLNEDFKKHRDMSPEEVLEEGCGASELKCWKCRKCP